MPRPRGGGCRAISWPQTELQCRYVVGPLKNDGGLANCWAYRIAIDSGPFRSNGTRVRSSIGAKILARWAAIATRLDLPDAPDRQCRYLEATVKGVLLASAGGRSQGIEEPYTSSKADLANRLARARDYGLLPGAASSPPQSYAKRPSRASASAISGISDVGEQPSSAGARIACASAVRPVDS
jgi:hypothetical protein